MFCSKINFLEFYVFSQIRQKYRGGWGNTWYLSRLSRPAVARLFLGVVTFQKTTRKFMYLLNHYFWQISGMEEGTPIFHQKNRYFESGSNRSKRIERYPIMYLLVKCSAYRRAKSHFERLIRQTKRWTAKNHNHKPKFKPSIVWRYDLTPMVLFGTFCHIKIKKIHSKPNFPVDHTDEGNVEYIVANGGERQRTRLQHQCTAVLDEQSSEPRVNMYKEPLIE